MRKRDCFVNEEDLDCFYLHDGHPAMRAVFYRASVRDLPVNLHGEDVFFFAVLYKDGHIIALDVKNWMLDNQVGYLVEVAKKFGLEPTIERTDTEPWHKLPPILSRL